MVLPSRRPQQHPVKKRRHHPSSAYRPVIASLLTAFFLFAWFDEGPPTRHKHESHSKLVSMAKKYQRRTSTQQSNRNNDHSKQQPKPFHIVFSTGCNAFQDWQSWAFLYQIYRSGQEGDVTRVASGCDKESEAVIRSQMQQLPTAERFHLHVTPDYSKLKPEKDYKFFNKPHGLFHWFQHGLGYPQSAPKYKDTIFVILDPDMFLLKPFQDDYTNDKSLKWTKKQERYVIEKGRPMTQRYGFGSRWLEKVQKDIPSIVKALTITKQQKSHLFDWTSKEIDNHYVAGPPYMAVGDDMFAIVKTWAEAALPVYDLTTNHLSEMWAYSTAAAHLELPHQTAGGLMMSEVHDDHEGWGVIDRAEPTEQVCSFEPKWIQSLPPVLHFCQRYYLGPYFFSKYKLPKTWLSCEHPLLVDPLDIDGPSFADQYDNSVTPNGEFNRVKPTQRRRHAFMICQITKILNEATLHWKKMHCDMKADTTNTTKTFVFPMDESKGTRDEITAKALAEGK